MQNDGKEIPHFSDQKRLFFPFNIMHIVYVSFIYGFVSTLTSSAIWALCEKGPSYFPQERWQMMASNVCKKIKAWGQYFLCVYITKHVKENKENYISDSNLLMTTSS